MIGREQERKELQRRYQRNKAEFIVVYGRWRVGKTFLIDETFEGMITFRHAGMSPVEKNKKGESMGLTQGIQPRSEDEGPYLKMKLPGSLRQQH